MAQVHALRRLSCFLNQGRICLTRSYSIGISQQYIVATSACFGQCRHTLLNNLNKQSMMRQKRNAGHSKWSNIKHIKAAKDKEKSALHSKFSMMIKLAVRSGGNVADPKVNTKLAQVLEQAKENNVSRTCIESALKGSIISKENVEPYLFEIKGPGKCFLIVETLSDNYLRTKGSIRFLLKKTNSIYADGISKRMFSHKGVIEAEDKDSSNIDKALEDAINVGAEDVQQITMEDGKNAFQFLSDPNTFWTVRTNLKDLNYNIISSSVRYLPLTKQPLSDDDISAAEKLYELLERLPEVVNIYDNIE